MAKVIKTAVSLPEPLYRRAEILRRKSRLSRSGLYAAALKAFFRDWEVREMEERYAAGYRAVPEDARHAEASVKMAAEIAEPEDW